MVLPCGAGKTLVGAAAMAHAQATTLILVTNTVSARQWKDELLRRTSLTEDEIGEYSGSVKEIRPVTIATYQVHDHQARPGVYRHLELLDARDWGLIVYDEVHLLPAPIFRMTADLQARRRIGLTATLVREDGREGDVFSLIGPKRYDAPWKDIESQGWIAPADCVEVRVTLPTDERLAYATAEPEERYRIASCTPQKLQVVRDLVAAHADQPTLVIGQYIDQLDELAAALDAPRDQGRDAGQGAAAALPGLPHRRGRPAGGLQGRELLHRPALRRGRHPGLRRRSARARRRPSGSAGCCGPRPRARPRTSTRSSPATPSTPTSPRTGSASSPSRATPTGSSTPRTSRSETVPPMSEMPPPGPPPGPPGPPPGAPPPPEAPMGWLRLTLQGSALTSSMITPAVAVNGWRVPSHYGENVIPVYAGPNRIEVSCQWLMKFGEATLEAQVPAGGQVSAFYAAPWHQFSRGAIGYEKQKRPGAFGFAVMMAAIVLVAVALFVLPNL